MPEHRDVCGSDITVRHLSSADWRELKQLRLAALRHDADALVGDLDAERRREPEAWRRLAGTGDWFAAFAGPEPVGVVSVVLHPETKEMYAESMWVDQDHRGRGVAGRLLLAVVDLARARHRTSVFLWVLEGHDRAAAVYRRHGFRETPNRQPAPTSSPVMEQEFRLDLAPRTSPVMDDAELLDDSRHYDDPRPLTVRQRP